MLMRPPRITDAYTAQRISESYDAVASLLARCGDVDRSTALDVGCGAANDSFGLGAYFDRVIALDTSRRAVAKARRVGRFAGVRTVTFRVRDAERDSLDSQFGFVLCNLMSHNARSRRALLGRVRAAMLDGAWLVYSEETEGYAPLEIASAIERRDVHDLTGRLRQIVNGCVRRPGFRFFFAGTMAPVLTRLGLEIHDHETHEWNGIPMVERAWCYAARAPANATAAGDADYLDPEADRDKLRDAFMHFASARAGGPLSVSARAEVERLAATPGSRCSPFLLFLLMVDDVPAALRLKPSVRERIGRRVPGLTSRSSPDWERLADVQRQFVGLMQERRVANR